VLDRSTPQGAKARALISDAYVAWLTTVRPNGQPQSSPVWFVVEDGEFLVFSLADTARIANLAANRRVSLNLDSNAGRDVVAVEGEATVGEGPSSLDIAAYQDKYRDGMRRIGHTPESFAARYPIPIRIKPIRWRVH
jgi:PPOX class probable F420-dependent enzyme